MLSGIFSPQIKTGPTSDTPETSDVTQRQDRFPFDFGPWGLQSGICGYTTAPGFGLATYRMMMRTMPVLQVAYAYKSAAACSAPFTIESQKGSSQEAKDLLQDHFLNQQRLSGIMACLMQADLLQRAPMSVQWGEVDGYQVPTRYKPLLQEKTLTLIDEAGEIVGIKQDGVEMTGPNYLLHLNQPEWNPIHGWSLLENIRETIWWPWMEDVQNSGKINNKASGSVYSVLGPSSGTYTTPGGDSLTGAQYAQKMANLLMQGISFGGTHLGHKIQGMANAETQKMFREMSEFTIQQWNQGNFGPASLALLEQIKHKEVNAFRGFQLPERAGLEGQHGTKADAGEHRDVVDSATDQKRITLATTLQHTAYWVLKFNFGEKEAQKHQLVPASVVDENLVFSRKIIEDLIANGYAGKIAEFLQMGGLFDKSGLPVNEKLESKINDPAEWEEEIPPAPDPNKPMNGNQRKINGNGDKALKRLSRFIRGN